jgi:hypothetical protein
MSEIVIGFADGSNFATDGKFTITCFSSEGTCQCWESEIDLIEYVSVNETSKEQK